MTNGDKLRSMTDEQIADLFTFAPDGASWLTCPIISTRCKDGECRDCMLDWLKQEVEE